MLIILAFAGTAVSLFGFANDPLVLGLLVLVVITELVILIVARSKLVCYRCRTRFARTPVAPYHQVFDPQIAELAINQPTLSDPVGDSTETRRVEAPLASRRARMAEMRIRSAEEAKEELPDRDDPNPD